MKNKILKIGILIREFQTLSNWELRIFDEILKNNNYEISLLIKDGRKGKNNPNNLYSRTKRLLKSKKIISSLIFNLQCKIEKYLFKPVQSVDRESIINQLKCVKTIELSPTRKGSLDIFSSKDSQKIKEYELDIILRHEFNIIRGDILKSSKHGIWSFHHADNSVNRGGPPCFWEIVLDQTNVGVTLQQLTPELDGGLIIDKSFHNIHWSFEKTKNYVFEASVSLIVKNLKLFSKEKYYPKKSTVYYNTIYKSPRIKYTLIYLRKFYFTLFTKLFQKINFYLFGIRYNCWTIFIGKGQFIHSSLFRLSPVKMPKNEFWADPFIFEYNDSTYVFFENYNYKKNLGKISCGKIDGNQIIDVCDVLDLGYHMSYPHVFKSENDIFLMPETSSKKRLDIFKCIEFPSKWELYSSAFEGQNLADATLFEDDNNQKWLFLNKTNSPCENLNDELYIYKIDSLKLNKIEPHQKNPVIINSKIARNAGSIFKYDNKFFRPSQSNEKGIYGRALNINRIDKLTIDDYIETTITTSYPNFKNGLISMHHLDQKKDFFVIDAAFKKA